MEPTLQKLFSALETQRQGLIEELKSLSSEKLNHNVKGKWSVSEIVGHLIQAETLSSGYIYKKINAINEVGNTGLWGEMKLWVFIISQRLPLKYKAPKSLGDRPKSYPDVQAVMNDWNNNRQQLEKLLEKFSADDLKKKIYRHPVMGRCNIVHCLIFFREHTIHHYPQIKRQV